MTIPDPALPDVVTPANPAAPTLDDRQPVMVRYLVGLIVSLLGMGLVQLGFSGDTEELLTPLVPTLTFAVTALLTRGRVNTPATMAKVLALPGAPR